MVLSGNAKLLAAGVIATFVTASSSYSSLADGDLRSQDHRKNGILEDGQTFSGVQIGQARSIARTALQLEGFELVEIQSGGRCLSATYSDEEIVDVYVDASRSGTVCAETQQEKIVALEWMFVPLAP